MDKQEIRILYHILDCIFPDLARNEYNRYELKPPEFREYVGEISFSEDEYKILSELKQKISGALIGGWKNS